MDLIWILVLILAFVPASVLGTSKIGGKAPKRRSLSREIANVTKLANELAIIDNMSTKPPPRTGSGRGEYIANEMRSIAENTEIQMDSFFKDYKEFYTAEEKAHKNVVTAESSHGLVDIENFFDPETIQRICENKTNTYTLMNLLVEIKEEENIDMKKCLAYVEDKRKPKSEGLNKDYTKERCNTLAGFPCTLKQTLKILCAPELKITTPRSCINLLDFICTLFCRISVNNFQTIKYDYCNVVSEATNKINLFVACEDKLLEKFKNTKNLQGLIKQHEEVIKSLKKVKDHCLNFTKTMPELYNILQLIKNEGALYISDFLQIPYDPTSSTQQEHIIRSLRKTHYTDLVRLQNDFTVYEKRINEIITEVKETNIYKFDDFIKACRDIFKYDFSILFDKLIEASSVKSPSALQKEQLDSIVKSITKMSRLDKEIVETESIVHTRFSKNIYFYLIKHNIDNDDIIYFPIDILLLIYQSNSTFEKKIKKLDIYKKGHIGNSKISDYKSNSELASAAKKIKSKYIILHINYILEDTMRRLCEFQSKNKTIRSRFYRRNLENIQRTISGISEIINSKERIDIEYVMKLKTIVKDILPIYKKILYILDSKEKYKDLLKKEMIHLNQLYADC
ncbi:hypothetical protein NEMIN01_1471 [Nematocida minor]|uniref:uncharacterized protein n=1 Tax=Nematocida minor TaxID=1912983 RepID=UPI00221FBEE9|nr:uncharacterized protein NEMIN01_1471 [Nematocida minor]KAI5191312.1 hypothetical protein NEMIN01_1471 [Nematocida minor]